MYKSSQNLRASIYAEDRNESEAIPRLHKNETLPRCQAIIGMPAFPRHAARRFAVVPAERQPAPIKVIPPPRRYGGSARSSFENVEGEPETNVRGFGRKSGPRARRVQLRRPASGASACKWENGRLRGHKSKRQFEKGQLAGLFPRNLVEQAVERANPQECSYTGGTVPSGRPSSSFPFLSGLCRVSRKRATTPGTAPGRLAALSKAVT